MEYGTMKLLAIEFKGNQFRGEIIPTLRKAEENETIFLPDKRTNIRLS
jgi:hypothetical protein